MKMNKISSLFLKKNFIFLEEFSRKLEAILTKEIRSQSSFRE